MPSPGYKKNAQDMLRVIRNHRRAAHGKATGYEKLNTLPVPLDHASIKDKALLEAAVRAAGTPRSLSARSTVIATPRSR